MADTHADMLARAIAGFGIPELSQPEPVGVQDEVWPRLLSRVWRERITGLAVESEASGWLALTDAQASELLGVHRDAMAWCLSVERKLVAMAPIFDAENIRYAVLKGASVAHTAYPEPGLRSFADLDLLVGAGDYDRACSLLRELGHARRQPEPRPGFDIRFGRASVHTHPDDRIEVDLHRTPGWGPFGQWIRTNELLDRRAAFVLGGVRISRLDDTSILLNVAMHAALGALPHRLVPLRDVLQVSNRHDVEWEVLSRWACEWRLAAVFRHAFEAASATLGVETPSKAQGLVVSDLSKRDSRALRAYIGDRRGRGGTSVATIRAIPGVKGKLAYASALALPDRPFLTARAGRGRTAYLRRWRVPARWAKAWVANFLERVSG